MSLKQDTLGKARQPMDPKVFDMVHGVKKRSPHASVAEAMCKWGEAKEDSKTDSAAAAETSKPSSQPRPESGQRLGTVRKTMATNVLLRQAPIGKCAPAAGVPSDMVFGRKSQMKHGGAAEALSSWDSAAPSASSSSSSSSSAPHVQNDGADFVQVNKLALKKGLVTTQQQHAHRHTLIEESKQTGAAARKAAAAAASVTVSSEWTFGKPSRQDISAGQLIKQEFGKEWLAAELEKGEARRAETSMTTLSRAETRATVLRHQHITQKPEERPPFVLKKFANVPPKLKTFRDGAGMRSATETTTVSVSSKAGNKENA